jgi:glutamyl-tRNA synthetase
LFSWAFARHHGGDFILRVEDTDEARSTQEAVDQIIAAMKWLELDHDEGPFFQMQRIERYREVIGQMLEAGSAYLCYCSPTEVDAMREGQRARGEKPRYDGRWRPEAGKVLPAVPEGVRPVVRFRNPADGAVTWVDMVKGPITISNAELDDLVIARASAHDDSVIGTPTYNFCVVVDDWDMQISHVIRGDDHVNNTPRQINIYAALGAPQPAFAHLPMIHGADGAKLSKRHGAVGVEEYQGMGYPAAGMRNYLTRLGWAHGDAEVFTRDQFVGWFDLDHLGRSPAQHNPEKLLWLNHHYIQHSDAAKLAEQVKPFALERGIVIPEAGQGPDFIQVVGLLKDRANTLLEIADGAKLFYLPAPAFSQQEIDANIPANIRPALADLITAFETSDGSKEGYSVAFKAVLAKHELKMPALAMPVRYALFATTQTPAIDAVLVILGKAETLQRLRRVLATKN